MKVFKFYIILLFGVQLTAQEVLISQIFNVRGDYAYDVMGQIEENVLLYRDKGFSKKLIALDTMMEFLWEKELQFEEKNLRVYGLVPQDTCFLAFYGFREAKEEILRVGKFDSGGNRLDTMEIVREQKGILNQEIQMILSEHKKKSLLYYLETNNKIRFMVFDNDTLGLAWQEEYVVDDVNFHKELKEILLSDKGDVFILLERNNSKYKKKKHIVEVMSILNDGVVADFTVLKLQNVLSQSLNLSLDPKQTQLGIFALYSDNKLNASNGFAYANINLSEIYERKWEFTMIDFERDFMYDLRGDSKNEEVKYLKIQDVVWRQDNGFLLFLEEQRSFSRRQNYSQGRLNSNFGTFRGWTDYFNEDIAVISIHPDGREHWQRVLYKKQFSQDDGAVFSSFFIFKTPSRIRLLYNDEIKNDNTVSEYVIGPMGKNKRSSVLSTEYQDLKLRFQDAIQTSSNELLVTSEKNSNLSLVKIRY